MSGLPPAVRHLHPLIAVLPACAVLLMVWVVAVPPWEAPDEPEHYQYANYIHDHGGLPPYDATRLEANEPPLYYAFVAPLAADVPAPVFDTTHTAQGDVYPHFPRVIRVVSGTSVGDYLPLYATRVATALLSLMTIVLVFAASREAGAAGTPAVVFLGLWPQFTFHGTNVSDDAMLAMLGAVVTLLLVRGVRRGFTMRLSGLLAMAGGAMLLTKITAVALIPAVALAVLGDRSPWRHRVICLAVAACGALLLVPWLVHNTIAYGDPLAWRLTAHIEAGLANPHPLLSAWMLEVVPFTMLLSSIGLFGWTDVWMPWWLYVAYGLVLAAAAAGVARGVVHRLVARRVVVVLMVAAAGAFAVAMAINLTYPQPQGRYLYPGLAAAAVLAGLGLESTPGWRRHPRLAAGALAVVLLAGQLVTLTGVVIPAYAR